MVDELHTEEDARMDALEDRTRVLAARVDAAEKRAKALAEELAGCGNSENSHACGACANCYRVGMREALDARGRAIAERDAAVKAKEEAEARADALRYLTRAEKAELEAASLRVQVDCGQDGVCAVAPGCTRHWEARNRELAAQVEQMRGALEAAEQELRPSTGHDVWSMREMEAGKGFGHKCPDCDRCRVLAKVRAALSPSPASGVAALEDDGHIRECGNGGEDPEDCSPACLVARVAAENGTCATCTTGYHDGCDSECSCRQCAPGKDEATR